mgnify:CR=1 FL=1
MKIGIMQPYFFPYIGYWQLINAVDAFVIYDDVNYIKGGWVNRNRVLICGQAKYINLQLYKASPNRLINEIELLGNDSYTNKLLRTIEASYRKAPFFEDIFSLIKDIVKQDERNLAKYLAYSIKKVCKYLGIETQLIMSSEVEKDKNLRGQEKIIEICKFLKGYQYINAIGGVDLYSREDFEDNKIHLNFLKTKDIKYPQFNNEFIPNLSIIDVLMFNSIEQTKRMLLCYQLI